METISGIVRNIAIVVLLASFLELLLPNNSMRRFVQLVMGLFVLMAVLSPVSKLLVAPLSFEIPAWSQGAAGNGDQELAAVMEQGNSLRAKGQEAAMAEYKLIIERQAKALALTVQGVEQVDLEVTAKDTGEIEQMKVTVGQSKPAIAPIKPVGGQEKTASGASPGPEAARISRELQTRLGTLLGIPENKILVSFQAQQ